jgi:hypothetical protein
MRAMLRPGPGYGATPEIQNISLKNNNNHEKCMLATANFFNGPYRSVWAGLGRLD